jgi:uncharacterized membrane protein (DUF106 family)
MVFFNAGIEIAIFSVILSVVSRWLQIRFGNKKEVNRIQAEMKKKQAQIQELLKKNDEKSKHEAETIQSGMMADMNKVMSSSMKVMMLSMIVFIPALAVLAAGYNGTIIQAPFPFVVFHRASGLIPVSFEWSSQFNWLSWYFWWSLVASLVLGMIFKRMKLE